MKITMVSKIRLDGTTCPKCEDVKLRLADLGLTQRIDEVVIYDERDPDSPGVVLAQQHNVDLAPFFVVEDRGATKVYTVFMRLVREVLQARVVTSVAQDGQEILRANPELDLL